MQQRRLGSGLSVVVLLVLAVALATGPDDPSVLVAPDVDLALPTGEGAGGELLEQTLIVRAQAFYLVLVKRWVRLAWFRGGRHEGAGERLPEDLFDTEDEFVGLGPAGVDEGVADLP